MNIFQKNIAALSERYPALARLATEAPSEGYQVIPSAEGGLPNLFVRNGEGGILFYEPADPLGHIRAVLGDLRLEKALAVIILGMGLGYPVNVLFSAIRSGGPLRKIILVERDIGCLRRALEILDLSEALSHPQVNLIVGAKEEDLYIEMWNAISPEFGALKAVKFVPWPASIRLAPDYYRKARQAVKDVARSFIAERGNDPYDNLVAYENFFENVPHYMANPGIHHVKDLFKGRPAVVVAAGPSLDKNVHLLRMLEDRAMILSADASLKVVFENGVVPHLVTTVERTPGTEKFFKGVSGLEETVLVVASFTYPTTISSYGGPLLFMHRRYQFYETLGIDEDCFDMGGTTAHCAFAVARMMGCDPIIFIGQDLAYGPDGVTHAKGCAFGQRQSYAADAERIRVPANGGGFVETCPLWLRLLREYERTLNGFDGLAINATEGGARIRGTRVMSFREAIERYCREGFQPRKRLLEHLSGKRPPVDLRSMLKRIESLEQEVGEVLDASQKILAQASPVLREVEKVEGGIPEGLSCRIREAISRVNSMADELMCAPLFKEVGEYFMSVWVPLLMEWQVVGDRFRDPAWADAYRLQLGEEGFGAIGQLCISLLDLLEKGKARVKGLMDGP